MKLIQNMIDNNSIKNTILGMIPIWGFQKSSGIIEKHQKGHTIQLDTKISKEELEAFWKGDEKTRRRLYSERMRKREKQAKKEGKQVTYVTPNSDLNEIIISAKNPSKLNTKMSTDDIIDYGITAAGFIPGLDTYADIADVGNQLRLGNYGQAALSAGLAFIPGLSAPMVRKGVNLFKDFSSKVRNYKTADKISSIMNESLRLNFYYQNKLVKQGHDPTRTLIYSTQGLPQADPETFYHYMLVPFGQPRIPKAGQVRLSKDKISPISGFNGREGRIWWTKGEIPNGGKIIITSKSPRINERVLEHPEKYKAYNGYYEPSYFTSGEVPLNEVTIYERNPFTGHYERGIPYKEPTQSNPQKVFNFVTPLYKKGYGKTVPQQLAQDFTLKNGGKLPPKHQYKNHTNQSNNIDTILNSYPEVSLDEEPWAREYFLNNPNVAGMAIGAGLNGVSGKRRVIVNPYNEFMKDPIQRKGLLTNERLRHYMDETSFKLPNITDQQLNKYKGTSYENDTLNIGRTEAARYLVNDRSNSLTNEQIKYVNSYFNKNFKK